MNMPKSRDIQVKMSSPKVILNAFWLVTVKVLNSYKSEKDMDGNILLWIQDHLRWEGMNWFWKGITSLGNGGWFWIVLCILMVVFAKTLGEKYPIKDGNCSWAMIGKAGWYGLVGHFDVDIRVGFMKFV